MSSYRTEPPLITPVIPIPKGHNLRSICVASAMVLLFGPSVQVWADTQSAIPREPGPAEAVTLCSELRIPPNEIEVLAAKSKPDRFDLPKTTWRSSVYPRRTFLMCVAESRNISDEDKLRAARIVLKQKKFDINLTDGVRYTVLQLAVVGHAPRLAQYLLEQGARTDIANGRDVSTPYLLAMKSGYRQLIDLFIERGSVDERDVQGHTALFYAAANGDLETVRGLVARGARPDASSGNVLAAAIGAGHVDVSRFLAAELNMRDDVPGADGRTMLMIAVARSQLSMVRYLVEERGARVAVAAPVPEILRNVSAISKAGKVDRALLSAGPIEFPTEFATGAFDNILRPPELIAGARESALGIAAATGNVDVMRYLFERGATNDDSKPSALSIAAHEGQKDAMQWLMQAGADLGPGTDDSPGVMYWGAIGRNPAVLDMLMERGAAIAPVPADTPLLARANADRNYGLLLLRHRRSAEALAYLREALAIYSMAVTDLAVRSEFVVQLSANSVGQTITIPPVSGVVKYVDGKLVIGSYTIKYSGLRAVDNRWRAVVVRDGRAYAFGPVSGIDLAAGEANLNWQAERSRQQFVQNVSELTNSIQCAEKAEATGAGADSSGCATSLQ